MTSPIKEFASLHNHTHYSVFDGLSRPEELLKAAKEKGLKSIALTDHGVTHGHADWFLLGKKLGVKTIYGVEAYVIHSLSEWKETKARIDSQKKANEAKEDGFADDGDTIDPKELRRKGHLVLLACDREGLSNLYSLVYKAHDDGFYGKPRMDKEMLREHARGLVASSACMGGVIAKRLWDMKDGGASWEDVKREALEYDDIFGRGRFFLELQFNEMDEAQNFINASLVRLHQETGIPLTVTTDSHYSRAEEWQARELLHMMGWSKKTINDLPDKKIETTIKQLYVKSPDEMWQTYELYAGHVITPDVARAAFDGPLMIDSLVTDFEPDVHQRLRTLPYKNPFEEMGRRAISGLKGLNLAERDEYRQRLLFELNVIKKKGIANYFLNVQRMVELAKKEMLVGPGRGSAAGSLVCYALGITDLDPIKHGLFFERFLDIDRAELPDVDLDFEDPNRVKEMLQSEFGRQNVASLSTYGTFQIKGLLKDLGRVYDLDHNEVNRVNRRIEAELRVLYVNQDKSTIVIKLEDIERVSPTFRAFVEQNPELGSHIASLYGRIRHVSRHASAVIIGDDLPRETSCFTTKAKKEKGVEIQEKYVQTSFTEGIVNKNLSAMGFVKMDLLGLANLRVIHLALDFISRRTGKSYEELRESLRAHNLDLNDQKVLKHVFWDGNFAGIFQFTGQGIRRLAQQVKPDCFVDVSAIVSLYRPGPLHGKYDQHYVRAKKDPNITYDHPIMEEVLKSTKGCLVFQEQLMQLCGKLGKMTGKDVNRVRKVLLKKDKSKTEEFLKKENDELFAKFQAGCKENGFPDDKVLKLWEDIKAFGGYAFNKAHSDAYSVITMQTAHLATYYPLEFYAACLAAAQSSDAQDILSDVQKTGTKVLSADINTSRASYSIEGDCIRVGLTAAKGVGDAAAASIITNRPYTSIPDFLKRSGINKTATIPLIGMGTFDSLQPNMRYAETLFNTYWANPDYKRKNRSKRKEDGKCWDDFVSLCETPPSDPDYSLAEKVFFENEIIGFSTRGSPWEILDRKKKLEAFFSGEIPDTDSILDDEERATILLPVVLKDFNEKPQKNKQLMAFMKFGTADGQAFEAPCFSTAWTWVKSRVRKGSVYLATFSRDLEEDPRRLVVGKPGFAHTRESCLGYFVDIDDCSL